VINQESPAAANELNNVTFHPFVPPQTSFSRFITRSESYSSLNEETVTTSLQGRAAPTDEEQLSNVKTSQEPPPPSFNSEAFERLSNAWMNLAALALDDSVKVDEIAIKAKEEPAILRIEVLHEIEFELLCSSLLVTDILASHYIRKRFDLLSILRPKLKGLSVLSPPSKNLSACRRSMKGL
jgi:hypothetical protein